MRFVDLVGKSARPPPINVGSTNYGSFCEDFPDWTNQSLKAIGNSWDENSEYLRLVSLKIASNNGWLQISCSLYFTTVLPALPGPCFLEPQNHDPFTTENRSIQIHSFSRNFVFVENPTVFRLNMVSFPIIFNPPPKSPFLYMGHPQMLVVCRIGFPTTVMHSSSTVGYIHLLLTMTYSPIISHFVMGFPHYPKWARPCH